MFNYDGKLPNLCCPGRERVKAMQWALPLEVLSAGKYGSFLGTGIGQHSGWTVWEESQARQSRIESGNPWNINFRASYLYKSKVLNWYIIIYELGETVEIVYFIIPC